MNFNLKLLHLIRKISRKQEEVRYIKCVFQMNRGTDENWVQILYKELTDSVHFKKPKTGKPQQS